uniref:5'-3' exoribonuclease 1 n=1 Tax=Parascaris univalens TaxID=6257 RepID=A0A915BD26_PARUN
LYPEPTVTGRVSDHYNPEFFFQIPEFDNLYLDMNGIIHGCTHPNDEDISFRISEEQIFRDIFNYIDTLFSIIEPKRVFFMAIDGVAPRAKMNQQRARRFMSAKNAELALKIAESKGQEIPKEKRFDPNCITPGTEFMARLHEQLQYFIKMKISTDAAWQGIRVYLSGHNCPGEGEHKIMDFIRSERSQPDYDANTRHCLYGLDADLIMLGLCSHEPHFSLLREEVKFGRPPKHKHKTTPKTGVDGITFHLLHLSLLREYLSWEFRPIQDKLSFPYDMESVIDDWILMGFLVGNDFIPHLPHVHIHEDALPALYSTYVQILPQLDGYLNEAGMLNLKRFEKFLKAFSKIDRQSFMQRMDDEDYLASKRTQPSSKREPKAKAKVIAPHDDDEEDELQPYSDSESENGGEESSEGNMHRGAFDSDSENEDLPEIEPTPEAPSAWELLKDGIPPLDNESEERALVGIIDEEKYENDCDVVWTHSVNRAFKDHKRNYYNDKMNYKNISKEELREQAEGYIRAIQWNLHYYYHGCCSWNWFYPHHYAPYISDVTDFADMEINFELSAPFHPFEQLMAVLPAASADCLPLPLQELMFDESSPILEFYPRDFETDLNGKKNDWEAVVLIPFINEKRLLDAIASKEERLTEEERRRNSHGPHLLFTTDPSNRTILKSSLSNAFPEIPNCIAKMTEVDMDEFRIPRSRVVHGLLKGVRMDVLFPGFPTMKHIPHSAELHFANISVFQQPSRKQSMILKIGERPELNKDMLLLAFDLIDKEVHIDWPILKRARVHTLWTAEKKYTKEGEDIVCNDLKKDEVDTYEDYVAMARKREFERCGIDVDERKGIALVCPMLGLQYRVEKQKVVIRRQWCPPEDARPVSINLLVQGALEDGGRDGKEYSLEEAYPVNSKVFIISPSSKYYGYSAVVRENNLLTKSTLTVSCTAPAVDVNFVDIIRNYDRFSVPWYSLHEIAKRTSLNKDVVARITGCVYMNACDRPTDATTAVYTSDRTAIGLELKFSKRNLSVPDYTRRTKEGYWQYSNKTVVLLQQYAQKFPEILKYIEGRHDGRDAFFASDIWPELTSEARQSRIQALLNFLHALPSWAVGHEQADGQFVESRVIAEVEKRTRNASRIAETQSLQKRLAVKPHAVYRDELNKGGTIPDEHTEYRLLDRVVCVRKTRNAPFGERGTVIGIVGSTTNDLRVDVLFDKPFFGAVKMRSERASGARLNPSVLLNLTHGMRLRGEQSLNSSHGNPTIPKSASASVQIRARKHDMEANSIAKHDLPVGQPSAVKFREVEKKEETENDYGRPPSYLLQKSYNEKLHETVQKEPKQPDELQAAGAVAENSVQTENPQTTKSVEKILAMLTVGNAMSGHNKQSDKVMSTSATGNEGTSITALGTSRAESAANHVAINSDMFSWFFPRNIPPPPTALPPPATFLIPPPQIKKVPAESISTAQQIGAAVAANGPKSFERTALRRYSAHDASLLPFMTPHIRPVAFTAPQQTLQFDADNTVAPIGQIIRPNSGMKLLQPRLPRPPALVGGFQRQTSCGVGGDKRYRGRGGMTPQNSFARAPPPLNSFVMNSAGNPRMQVPHPPHVMHNVGVSESTARRPPINMTPTQVIKRTANVRRGPKKTSPAVAKVNKCKQNDNSGTSETGRKTMVARPNAVTIISTTATDSSSSNNAGVQNNNVVRRGAARKSRIAAKFN